MFALGHDEAGRLGHHWVGEDHVLLALSRLDGPVGEALRAAGATPERIDAALVRGVEASDPPIEPRDAGSPRPTPAVYSAFGRAEGLALAAGDEMRHEDVLVALVWPGRLAAGLLERLGVDRAELFRSLAGRGLRVPPGEPDPFDGRPTRRVDVPFEQLMTIVHELPERLPAGGPFGFNLDPGTRRAWIFVGDEVEVQPLIEEIVERHEGAAG